MNDSASPSDIDDDLEPDPLFLDSLREARWILLMWATCFAWTLTVCLNYGYPTQVDPKTFPTVLGIPAWVAWGIAFPWLVANVVTITFCLGYMKDGDLGDDASDHTPMQSSSTDRSSSAEGEPNV